MNKLQGFRALRELGIPAVPWNFMNENTKLNPNFLWTIRTAVEIGNDVNLPKAIGINSKIAYKKYKEFKQIPNVKIIYYPFFFADISGVVDISNERTVIEACNSDLWNLVTYDKPDYRVIIKNHNDINNLGQFQLVFKYAKYASLKMKGFLELDKHLYLEWSLARNSNLYKEPCDEQYLVFYECKAID